MWCWKKTMRVSWTEQMTNNSVLSKVNETRNSVLDTVRVKRWNPMVDVLKYSDELLQREKKQQKRQIKTSYTKKKWFQIGGWQATKSRKG